MAAYILIDARLREKFEKLEFSQRTQTKESMFEWQNFLDRHLPPGRLVHSSSYGTVGALHETMKDAVAIAYIDKEDMSMTHVA